MFSTRLRHLRSTQSYPRNQKLRRCNPSSALPRRSRMDYYRCPNPDLLQEISRRGYRPYGSHDQLSEGLRRDDETRGSEATTVETTTKGFLLSEVNVKGKTGQSGTITHANLLVGERIVHWTMNTFFPTLQLFFDSGLSCTIEGTQSSDTIIGLDRQLRFRLTDLTHEEDGRLVKTTLPEKFAGATPSIGILEATVARRTSIAVKQNSPEQPQLPSSAKPRAFILREMHVVVGLRLEGMQDMAYVWARNPTPSVNSSRRTWDDTRVAGLRDDIPTPFLGFPQHRTKAGGEAVIVTKGSMIRNRSGADNLGKNPSN